MTDPAVWATVVAAGAAVGTIHMGALRENRALRAEVRQLDKELDQLRLERLQLEDQLQRAKRRRPRE